METAYCPKGQCWLPLLALLSVWTRPSLQQKESDEKTVIEASSAVIPGGSKPHYAPRMGVACSNFFWLYTRTPLTP